MFPAINVSYNLYNAVISRGSVKINIGNNVFELGVCLCSQSVAFKPMFSGSQHTPAPISSASDWAQIKFTSSSRHLFPFFLLSCQSVKVLFKYIDWYVERFIITSHLDDENHNRKALYSNTYMKE